MKLQLTKPGMRGSALSQEVRPDVRPNPTPALADQPARKPARKPDIAARFAAAEAEAKRRDSPEYLIAEEDANDKRIWADPTQPVEERLAARMRIQKRRYSGLITDR
jgi:hypothetical protein